MFGDLGEAGEGGFATRGGAVLVAEVGEVLECAECAGGTRVFEEFGEGREGEFEVFGNVDELEIGFENEFEGAVDEFDGGLVGAGRVCGGGVG